MRSAEVRLGTTTVATTDFRGACKYDDWNACPKQQTRVGVDIDTTNVPDGTHRLLLTVTDAAGNVATVDTRQSVVVANAAGSGGGGAGGGGAGGSGADGGAPARGVADSDRGAHNGGGDATAAILTAELVNRRSAMVVPYRRSAVTISGRITQRDGTPISGARLDVTSTSVQAGDPGPDAGQVVTDDDGRWRTTTVRGPSRRVTVGWRAYDRDRSYAETTELTLLVRAGVRLVARPRTVRNGGRVVLSGRLLGRPFPRGGILVTLQGKPRRGKWRTFGVTRTRATGRFRYRYRFTRVRGRQRFAFRARIARQDGYPYEPAVAGTTKATVRG